MARIVHIALRVRDLEATTRFYEEVFGFRRVEEGRVRDHVSRHLSDGTIDLALIQYDAGADSAEARASGVEPCIHHFGVEVEDVDTTRKRLLAAGCRMISEPGVVPIKFRDPGGVVAEIVPEGRYRTPE
ncbi:MAG TPA: VOC family protein [Methylomirabilota bacterium]|jgi:lactoylglutathione lyase|nr:VOC family protein [Methylomirabilota bacterium]